MKAMGGESGEIGSWGKGGGRERGRGEVERDLENSKGEGGEGGGRKRGPGEMGRGLSLIALNFLNYKR